MRWLKGDFRQMWRWQSRATSRSSSRRTHKSIYWKKRLQEKLVERMEYALLTSVPGIGRILATIILLETGPIERFRCPSPIMYITALNLNMRC